MFGASALCTVSVIFSYSQIVCICMFCRVYFKEELAAKEAILTDQSHIAEDEQHHVWSVEQNEKFNQKSAALR